MLRFVPRQRLCLLLKPSLHFRTLASMTKNTTLIIEQLNPLESGSNAKYDVRPGTLSFNDFILSYPRGAYTGMRTIHRNAIVELGSHMKRINTSLSLMDLTHPAHPAEQVGEALASFMNEASLEEKLVPMLRQGLEAYYAQVDPTSNTVHPSEAKVSLMVAYSFETKKPCFAAHFGIMHTHPPNERVKVEVEEKARTDPIVKDSQWVRERAGLEREKPKDVNEVILMDHDGLLYEGMASNFLAIRSKPNGDPVVMCAPLDHILLGTILKIVIRICEKHNIEMDWSFPTLQDAKDGKWEDCCVTSTSRLLLPIKTMYYNHLRNIIEFEKPSKTMEFLRHQVELEIANAAYRIIPEEE